MWIKLYVRNTKIRPWYSLEDFNDGGNLGSSSGKMRTAQELVPRYHLTWSLLHDFRLSISANWQLTTDEWWSQEQPGAQLSRHIDKSRIYRVSSVCPTTNYNWPCLPCNTDPDPDPQTNERCSSRNSVHYDEDQVTPLANFGMKQLYSWYNWYNYTAVNRNSLSQTYFFLCTPVSITRGHIDCVCVLISVYKPLT